MDDDKEEEYSRKRRRILFYPILIAFTIITTNPHHVSAQDDASVMSKLAKSITPSPYGWSGSNPCKWSGVQCDNSGKVTAINIGGRSLSGEIPSELNQLSSLKSLSLQKNQLSGSLPPLSKMPALQEVRLDNNNFTSVPSGFLSGLTGLQKFSMDGNPKLPPWTIPDSLTESISLASFSADSSNIVGSIPNLLGSFPSLEYLKLSYNNLTGSLPESLAKSEIQTLILNNQAMGLSGMLDVIGSMSQLSQAWLHVNGFTGPIPDLSGLGSLFDLQLRDNQLTGVIPETLSGLPKLANVSMQNNKLQGPMPSFPEGVQVSLGNTNNFCNDHPGPCDPLVTTLLEVASGFSYPMKLAESWKGNDPCNGWDGITCYNGGVTVINFAKHDFSGIISPTIANISSLKSLILSDNKIYGTVPSSLTRLSHLQILDVSNNNISGKVPEFPSRVTVRTSGNSFIGKDVPITPPGSLSKSSRASSPPASANPSSTHKASVSP